MGLPDTAGTMMLAILGQMNDSQWWPPELLRQKQLEQLDQLLKYARGNVPYYRDTLPKRVACQSTEEYLLGIPILDRESVRTNFQSLQSTDSPASHGDTSQVSTSGSVGKPVKVTQTAMFTVFEACGLLRQHRWHNRDFQGVLASIMFQQSNIRGKFPKGPDFPNWGWPVDVVYPSGPASLLELKKPVNEQVKWLLEKNPDYILSPPSNLQNLAEYCIKNKITFARLKNVSTLMEVVTADLRVLCKQAWNVPVIDNYSCREVGTIASQCPENTHYHVCAENVLVEILDEQNQPCKVGESGRVVVTSLRNFAMPLIRYELSDHAQVGEVCSCGRGLPVLNQVMGRVRNMLKLPNGEKRWARMGRPKIMKLAPVKQYQFVQTKLDTIEIRLVTERPFTDEDEARLSKHFLEVLPYPYKLVYKYLKEIPRTSGGKIEDFTCQV